MTKLLTALAVAGCFTFAAGSAALAAPVGTPGTGSTLNMQSLIQQTQYYGGGYRRNYYRPACYYVRRCSGYYPYQRCWRERICR